jgi:hypothetical protein
MLARLEHVPPAPPRPPALSRRWRPLAWAAAFVAASAAAVWLALLLLQPPPRPGTPPQKMARPGPPVGEPVEPLEVAVAEEVEILSVGGADTATLVVGLLPLQGPMELAREGEVEVTQAKPVVRMGPGGTPMIWTPLDEDEQDPDEVRSP